MGFGGFDGDFGEMAAQRAGVPRPDVFGEAREQPQQFLGCLGQCGPSRIDKGVRLRRQCRLFLLNEPERLVERRECVRPRHAPGQPRFADCSGRGAERLEMLPVLPQPLVLPAASGERHDQRR